VVELLVKIMSHRLKSRDADKPHSAAGKQRGRHRQATANAMQSQNHGVGRMSPLRCSVRMASGTSAGGFVVGAGRC
jgi:hypothetical protein